MGSVRLSRYLIDSSTRTGRRAVASLHPLVGDNVIEIRDSTDSPAEALQMIPRFHGGRSLLMHDDRAREFRLPATNLTRSFLSQRPALQAVPMTILLHLRIVLIRIARCDNRSRADKLFRRVDSGARVSLSFSLS